MWWLNDTKEQRKKETAFDDGFCDVGISKQAGLGATMCIT